MDIFVRLLADDVRSSGPDAALTALESTAAMAARDPHGARERLRREGRRHRDLFGIDGAFHEVYRAAFEALIRRVPTSAGAVRVVRCAELAPAPSPRAVQHAVRRVTEPLVLVRCEAPADVAGAGAADELEALTRLADEPGLGMVVIGAGDALLRREVLLGPLRSDRSMAPDAVVDALARIVRDAGMTVRSVAP